MHLNYPLMNERLFPEDPYSGKRVNIYEKHELEFWSKVFMCSESDLMEAVCKVGTKASAVDHYLTMNLKKQKSK